MKILFCPAKALLIYQLCQALFSSSLLLLKGFLSSSFSSIFLHFLLLSFPFTFFFSFLLSHSFASLSPILSSSAFHSLFAGGISCLEVNSNNRCNSDNKSCNSNSTNSAASAATARAKTSLTLSDPAPLTPVVCLPFAGHAGTCDRTFLQTKASH